jgi:2-oxoglutarate dehydrogenase E1 component
MERFLQQCADLNMQIVNTSTPSNHFHLLRRQLKREFRKPLVVFSPKMLLRYPAATSSLEEMANGGFQEVIDDKNADPKKVDTLVLCSGKFYYEMKEKAEDLKTENIAFVRIEQLYPFPQKQIDALLKKYDAKNTVWVQEEPSNMGAWTYMAMNLRKLNLIGICRPASAASAEGSKKLHEKRLAKLFSEIFAFAKISVGK